MKMDTFIMSDPVKFHVRQTYFVEKFIIRCEIFF